MRRIMSVAMTVATVTIGSAAAQTTGSLSQQVREFIIIDGPVIALTDVRVIDGTGGPPREGQTIVIADGRIQQVGPSHSVDVPRGAQRLTLRGHTVIPGIVGMHNHTFYTTTGRSAQLSFSAPRLYLASGVTTIRTTGSSSPYAELNLKRDIDRGRAPGPRMHITGPYLQGSSGAGGDMYHITGPEDARRVVAYWAEEGATWFKAYNQIGRAELGAAIEEAHSRGLKVTGHLCSVSFREAVALGIDNIEHGFFTNTDYDPDKPDDTCPMDFRDALMEVDLDGPEVQATFRDMVGSGVAMTSTLAVYELFVPGRPPIDERMIRALADGPRQEYLRTREQLDISGTTSISRIFRKAMDYERAFVNAGGLLAAGVDPTGNGGALPGFGDQRNYELLIEAGFAPEEVIQIMSANGAKILGVDDELGTIEVGKIADLVIIDGNPVSNPRDIRNVTIVFKDGLGYDSPRLIESVRGVVGVR